MPKADSKIVVLGLGGTIAGVGTDPGDSLAYEPAKRRADQLVAAVPDLAGLDIQVEQVAQLDSKDMEYATWHLLAQSVAYHLDRSDVSGIVITHGTDTLEETAYLLQRVLAPDKPVVLTAAMRPATALLSDGPQNLLDAVRVAQHAQARGVVVVVAGMMHSALDVRKVHTYRLDAFGSGDVGPLGAVQGGVLRLWRPWPSGEALGLKLLAREKPPRVDIVFSHAGADGSVVEALRARGIDGIVVAGTGNGTVHARLQAALTQAQQEGGVQVLRCTRVAQGAVTPTDRDLLLSAGALSPAQTRVELMLRLLAAA